MTPTNRFVIIAIILLSPFVVWGQGSEPSAYTLQACIDYALENNANVKNAALDMKVSEAVVKQTIAGGLPSIEGNLDLGFNYKVPTTQLPAIIYT